MRINLYDLGVALLLTIIGVYLILYSSDLIIEFISVNPTALGVYASFISLVLPLIGVVLVVSAIIVLVT